MHLGFLEQVKFKIGPFAVNSRELIILVAVGLFLVAVLVYLVVAMLRAATKVALAWIRGNDTISSRDDVRAFLKRVVWGGAYVLWIVIVTLVLGEVITDWKPLQNFSTIAVLLSIAVACGNLRKPEEEFRQHLRRQTGYILVISTFLSIYPYPLYIELALTGVLLTLRLGAWMLKLSTNVDDNDEMWMLELIGRSWLTTILSTSLVLGFVGLTVVGLGPGLWRILADWPQGAAGEVGTNLYPWIFYFPPLVLPLVLYRAWGVDGEDGEDGDSKRHRQADSTRSEDDDQVHSDVSTISADVTLAGNAGAVGAMVFSPDGELLATSEGWPSDPFGERMEAAFHLWRSNTGERVGEKLEDWWLGIPGIAFSADGHTLATSSSRDGAVHTWDLADPANPQRLDSKTNRAHFGFGRRPTRRALALTFQKDGMLAAFSEGENVQLYDLTADRRVGKLARIRRPKWELSPDPVRCVEMFAEQMLVAVVRNNRVEVWNMMKGRRIGRRIGGYSAAFSTDGTRVAVGARGMVRIRKTKRWSSTTKLRTTRRQVVGAIAMTSKGILIAGDDGRIVSLWNLCTGDLVCRFRLPHRQKQALGDLHRVTRIAISPDEETVAIADLAGNVWLCSLSRLISEGDPSARASLRELAEPHTSTLADIGDVSRRGDGG